MGYYIFSAIAGAIVAVIIALLARSQLYILAGLAPLFPTFALFAHILSFKNGGITQVRDVALFGLWSMIPYFFYVGSIYLTVSIMRFEYSVLISLCLWCLSAFALFMLWNKA